MLFRWWGWSFVFISFFTVCVCYAELLPSSLCRRWCVTVSIHICSLRRWCQSSLRRNKVVLLFEGSARRCRNRHIRGELCLQKVKIYKSLNAVCFTKCDSLLFISQRSWCQSDNPGSGHSSSLPSSLSGTGRHVVQRSSESCRYHCSVQDVQQHGPSSCRAGEERMCRRWTSTDQLNLLSKQEQIFPPCLCL